MARLTVCQGESLRYSPWWDSAAGATSTSALAQIDAGTGPANSQISQYLEGESAIPEEGEGTGGGGGSGDDTSPGGTGETPATGTGETAGAGTGGGASGSSGQTSGGAGGGNEDASGNPAQQSGTQAAATTDPTDIGTGADLASTGLTILPFVLLGVLVTLGVLAFRRRTHDTSATA